jgi:bacterial/archaeal transporter family protein
VITADIVRRWTTYFLEKTMWMFYALLSSISAALVAIFGKMGLRTIDSTLATTIRGIIMALFLIFASLALKKFSGFSLHTLSGRDWILIILAGVAGALSWLFYFFALKHGPATGVVAIDRMSLVFVAIMASLFFAEAFTWKTGVGVALMVGGALLLAL